MPTRPSWLSLRGESSPRATKLVCLAWLIEPRLDQDLLAAHTGHDLIAESRSRPAQALHRRCVAAGYSEGELAVLADFFDKAAVVWEKERQKIRSRPSQGLRGAAKKTIL